ncbi:hypothetical protein BJX96DRAFT_139424 [Aspergillus floccosus]
MSSSSIIFHQGLRCTKVPRKSKAIATSSSSSPESATSLPSAATGTSVSDPAPTQVPTALDDAPTSSTSSMSISASVFPVVAASDTTTSTVISTGSTTGFVSSQSAQTTSTQSSGLETPTIHTASSTGLFTPTSTSTGNNPFQTNADRHTSGPGGDDASQASLRTLLGSVFGGMAFIALVFLAFVLFYCCRRRKSRTSWAFSPAEKLLRSGRDSPYSPTSPHNGRQSNMSWYSDGSSIRSLYHYLAAQQPLMSSPLTDHHARHSNPFSDTAPLQRSSLSSIEGHSRGPLIDTSDPLPMQQAILPRRAFSADWGTARPGITAPEFPLDAADQGSIHSSERSLGSTVILPGRSSMGSSLQRFSYQMSLAELGAQAGAAGAGAPTEPVTRVSTRSDPFDLEMPAKAMHRRSSGALPGGILPQV